MEEWNNSSDVCFSISPLIKYLECWLLKNTPSLLYSLYFLSFRNKGALHTDTEGLTDLHPAEQGGNQSQHTSADPQSSVRHLTHCIITDNRQYRRQSIWLYMLFVTGGTNIVSCVVFIDYSNYSTIISLIWQISIQHFYTIMDPVLHTVPFIGFIW